MNCTRADALTAGVHDRICCTGGRCVGGGGRGRCQGGWAGSVRSRIAGIIDAPIGAERADAQDFKAAERALRRQALGLAAQAIAQHFNADDSDHSDSTIACACGGGYASPLFLDDLRAEFRRLQARGDGRPGRGRSRSLLGHLSRKVPPWTWRSARCATSFCVPLSRSAQPADSTSACSSTVRVADSCLSGG